MYKKVLLATDLLADDRRLIERGVALAKSWSAELFIVHVVEPLPGYGYAYVGAADVENKLLEEARDQLAELGREYHVPTSHQIVDVGATKTEITRIAEEYGVDLIVLGSHGRHGLSYLLGSTANAVLHHAKCDVLTVRLRV